jgi:hypothetical protein
MTKLIEYIGAAVMTVLPAILAAGQYCNPSKEVQLKLSPSPNAICFSYPGEYQARNFQDVKPFGSLDEVVLRTKEGKVLTLQRGGDGFADQEQVYLNKVFPVFER